LSEDSIEKLDKIGFTWDSYQYTFDRRLSQLIEYKDLNGDCNVHRDNDSNPGRVRRRCIVPCDTHQLSQAVILLVF